MTRIEFIHEWRRRGNNQCFYCGSEFDPPGTLMGVSEEHIYPKHKYHSLPHNTVKACLGCNYAKNGFEPSQFREWMGEKFYAEWLLGEPLPLPQDSLLHELYWMVDRHFDMEKQHQAEKSVFGGKPLTMKLRKIIREARAKSTAQPQYPLSSSSVSEAGASKFRGIHTRGGVLKNKGII